jgi:XTP/dITP diphosphohydrolase
MSFFSSYASSTLSPPPSPRATSILHPQIFSGTCEGRIDSSPRGKGGFGYDPLFIPNGFELSFAGLGEDVKNKLSHRAKALAKLQEFFHSKN